MNDRSDARPSAEPWWQRFRALMPVCEQWSYLDHAAIAPLPAPTRATLTEWADDISHHGGAIWGRWRKRLEETRRLGAELLGAATEEIALIRNTTEGVSLIAEGFPWSPGDNAIIFQGEFPTNRYPWLNLRDRGVEIREIATDRERYQLDQVRAACDRRTRVIAVSWVGYATGWRSDLADLAELAHGFGAALFVDAIQGLGVIPLDWQKVPVDFLAADGHKWLLGPEGAGLLYVRQKWLDRLRPLGVGWNSARVIDYTQPELDLKPTAARYEGGTYNTGGLAALGTSLELLLGFGIDQIADRVLSLTDQLGTKLTSCGAVIASDRDSRHASGIVACEFPGRDSLELKHKCLARGVVVTCRAGRLRISPHAYNTEADLDRLVTVLSSD